MSRRSSPGSRRLSLTLPAAMVLVLAGAWVLGAALSGGSSVGGVPAASGSGASLSRVPMAAQGEPFDDCDGCSAVQEAEVVATATPIPEPTATPTPVPTPSPYRPSFDVPARAVAILEAPCGALVYGKSEHASLPPASLTKIVTAMTVIDRVDLNDSVEVEISAKELKRRTRSSVMGLEPGMTVTVEDLLYGLFLPSGNDAAIELAEHVSGNVSAFVALMNEEAARLGLNDSRFSNPHGLDSPAQRSSAYDMALAGLEMMKNQTLAAISSTPSYTLDGGLTLLNSNQLLTSYPGSSGVKIGYTRAARYTIVASASRDGRDLYAAVLGSDDLYSETATLLDWAFKETPKTCAD
jgi:D-alanyl-D-alanine carboxypeptidase